MRRHQAGIGSTWAVLAALLVATTATAAERNPFVPIVAPAGAADAATAAGGSLRLAGSARAGGRVLALLEDATGTGFVVESGTVLPTLAMRITAVEWGAVEVSSLDGSWRRRLTHGDEE